MQRNQTHFSRRGVSDRGDTSDWTDDPEEKRRKAMGLTAKTTLQMAKDMAMQRVMRDKNLELQKAVQQYNEEYRSESLLTIHLKKDKEPQPPPDPPPPITIEKSADSESESSSDKKKSKKNTKKTRKKKKTRKTKKNNVNPLNGRAAKNHLKTKNVKENLPNQTKAKNPASPHHHLLNLLRRNIHPTGIGTVI